MSAANAQVLEQYAIRPELTGPRRWWRATTDFVRTKPLGAASALIILVLVAMAVAPSVFATDDSPNTGTISERLQGPSGEHLFGTDQFGRDMYSRIIYGARTSMIIGILVILVSSTIATILGVFSGYFGGWVDILVQRVVDIGISLPGLIFIILVVTSLQDFPPESTGLDPSGRAVTRIAVSLGILVALGSSRVIRGQTIATKQNQYVEAARVVGARDLRIIVRHILPNVFTVIIVGASIQIGSAILVESSLSFLGYGVQPPTASWGRMLTEARVQITNHPHLAIFPGAAIFLTVYSFNMFGDALRDVLDPRLRGSR
ncbi:MAG: ABC transporter permease [Hyphomicrobiales bacterium]